MPRTPMVPMTPILMPQVGENLTTGSIVEWLKAEQDPVARGEIVLTVESEKAVFEVEAEIDGVLAEILCEAGQEVEILQPVGYISQPGEALESARHGTEATASASPAPAAAQVQQPMGPRRALANARGPASPSARRLARELGVDLTRLQGSGPGGRIVKADVLAAGPAAASGGGAEVHEDCVEELTGLRRHIAARTTLSLETIPHFYVFTDVDMSAALAWRERLNRQSEIRVTITDLIAWATAHALRRFERLNAHMKDDRVAIKHDINIGLATAVDGGMLIPVIVKADDKSLQQLAATRRDLVAAVRRGKISLGPASGFTISNLGMHGVGRLQPIINPPECAILGVGAVEERVISRDRTMAVADVMSLCLGCDHRAIDGVYAARFLTCLRDLLEHPEPGPGDQRA